MDNKQRKMVAKPGEKPGVRSFAEELAKMDVAEREVTNVTNGRPTRRRVPICSGQKKHPGRKGGEGVHPGA